MLNLKNSFQKKEINKIPPVTGVYLFKDKNKKVIYVGKALNLQSRIASYFQKQDTVKKQNLKKEIETVEIIRVNCEVEALILEANLIKKHLAKYNINLRDDKSFLYLAITREEFPKVLVLRKKQLSKNVKYFYGPFPSATIVKQVAKILRRLFPYCTDNRRKKACFYSHLNLCNPCPFNILKEKGNEEKYLKLKNIYRQNIGNIKKILDGNLLQVKNNLEKEMQQLSKKEEFEKAKMIFQKLQMLEYISRPYDKVASFLDNSNFWQEKQAKAVTTLTKLVKHYYPFSQKIKRIEGIDISNLANQQATGSLVVFVNGIKQPQLYKRFKIRKKGDDTKMIKEVVERRLKHREWPYPDLLLVDGGKTQLSSTLEALDKKAQIPVIALVKQIEKIIIYQKGEFKTIILSRYSPALQLIQEVRDESHRFAKKYHQLLRKQLIKKLK